MTPIRLAVVTALAAGAATSAQALNISTYSGNSANNVNVYLTGSTAIDNTLLNTEIASTGTPAGICQANTIDVYQIGAPAQRLVYCSASGGVSGITAGTPIAIFKESVQGSINGAAPLINLAKGLTPGVSFISPSLLVAAGGDTDCTTSTVAATTAFSAYTLHAACAGSITADATITAGQITGGVADVEAPLLRLPGGGSLSSTDINGLLSGAPGLDVVWGVAVTKNLYYALQTGEGLSCPVNSSGVTLVDSVSCAPSLSKTQVASLYASGSGLFNWNQIIGISNSTDNNVYVCRRDIGSGTEASFEAYFLNARCSLSDEKMADEDGTFVFASGGTGGVRTCLQAFFSGGTIVPYNLNTVPATTYGTVVEPGGQWAIGVISSEVSSSNLSGANDSFRMVAVDGVLPTLDNTVNGFWPYFSTDAFYNIKAGKTNAPTGAPLTVFQALQARVGHPLFTSLTNTGFAGRPWGNGGDLAPASLFFSSNTPTIPATATTVGTNPTNAFTKAPAGGVNNCDTPQLYNNGGTSTTPVQKNLLGTGNINN